MAMVKTPFDGEAKKVKVTRKQKERKLKAIRKSFGKEIEFKYENTFDEKKALGTIKANQLTPDTKIKTRFNKVSGADFKFSHDRLPILVKVRNGNREQEYVRPQCPPEHVKPQLLVIDPFAKLGHAKPKHVKPKIEPELTTEEIKFVRYAMKGQKFKDDLVSLLGILVIAIYFYAMVLR